MTQTIHQLMRATCWRFSTSATPSAAERRYRGSTRPMSDGPTTRVSPWDTRTRRQGGALQDKHRTASIHRRRARSPTVGFGYLAWHLVGTDDNPTPQVSGFDVAIIRDDVIAELYTVLTAPAP